MYGLTLHAIHSLTASCLVSQPLLMDIIIRSSLVTCWFTDNFSLMNHVIPVGLWCDKITRLGPGPAFTASHLSPRTRYGACGQMSHEWFTAENVWLQYMFHEPWVDLRTSLDRSVGGRPWLQRHGEEFLVAELIVLVARVSLMMSQSARTLWWI